MPRRLGRPRRLGARPRAIARQQQRRAQQLACWPGLRGQRPRGCALRRPRPWPSFSLLPPRERPCQCEGAGALQRRRRRRRRRVRRPRQRKRAAAAAWGWGRRGGRGRCTGPPRPWQRPWAKSSRAAAAPRRDSWQAGAAAAQPGRRRWSSSKCGGEEALAWLCAPPVLQETCAGQAWPSPAKDHGRPSLISAQPAHARRSFEGIPFGHATIPSSSHLPPELPPPGPRPKPPRRAGSLSSSQAVRKQAPPLAPHGQATGAGTSMSRGGGSAVPSQFRAPGPQRRGASAASTQHLEAAGAAGGKQQQQHSISAEDALQSVRPAAPAPPTAGQWLLPEGLTPAEADVAHATYRPDRQGQRELGAGSACLQ